MIHSSKKLEIEFFDKKLNGTVTGTYRFKTPIELDSDKRTKLPTQLRQTILKMPEISKHINCKGNGAVMLKLVFKDNFISALIDLRK